MIYIVNVEATLVVKAESEEAAVAIAEKAVSVEDHGAEVNAFVTGEVHHVTALPVEWDGGCLPFGGDGEETIAQILTRSR
jgi:hypothetical protein